STTIIAKAFGEQGVGGRLKELVLGILIIEDLIAIMLMTTLTAVSSGAGVSAAALAITIGKLAAFLVGLLVVGLLIFPRFMRLVVALGRPETTLVASIGICFAVALLASELEYSSALGAFIAGSLIAETGEGKRIEHLVQPVRDMFAAIFFVSVGMLIDPKLVLEYWQPILVLTLLVIAGKTVGVSFGAFLTGAGTRTAIQAGMAMSQIGEFSFIIASLGLTLGATGKFLYPVAITVSALTTLTTPFMIRASDKAAAFVDRKLPPSLQTFTSLYSSWVEQLKSAKPKQPGGARRRIQLLVVDAAMLVGIVIITSLYGDEGADWLEDIVHISREAATLAILSAAALIAIPLVIGLVTVARRLGRQFAERVMPLGEDGRVDLAATPRRALVVAFELATVLLVGAPLLAITQPFLRGFHGLALFLLFGVALAFLFWRSATDLQGHVRAGAEVLVAAIAQQAQAGPSMPSQSGPVFEQIDVGLGRPVSIQLLDGSAGAGKTLAQLNLRGATGASALAIIR
ncbi:MAG TPA: cation:proton antiporter, partial [Myxococcota bacterium]